MPRRDAVSRFILASGSPRRRDLLTAAGFLFDIAVSDAEERSDVSLSGGELTRWNAARKAHAVARTHPDDVVLAADTLVVFEGQVIGKPRDLADAAETLRRLSGRSHQVVSAVSIVSLSTKRNLTFEVFSHVRFRKLSSREIAAYLRKIDPLDKAGAYAAQDGGSDIIAEIRGSFSNVVGLPMEETTRALARFGVLPAQSVWTTSRSTGLAT